MKVLKIKQSIKIIFKKRLMALESELNIFKTINKNYKQFKRESKIIY